MHSASSSRPPEQLPIPKGNSPYAQAKRAEYLAKDMWAAKALYRQAISLGDRTESALKDLASLLHQEGRTQEACSLLLEFQHCFTDYQKFLNLYQNLQDKIHPTGKSLNKSVKIALTAAESIDFVRSLFKDPSRILSVDFSGLDALVHFPSHSAARKTLATFHKWARNFTVEWVNIHGEVVGDVWDFKRRNNKVEETDDETAQLLLGKELMAELSYFSVAAKPFVPCRYN